MFQPVAWYQSTGNTVAGEQDVDAVFDQTVFTEGKEVRVPPGRNFLLGEWLLTDTDRVGFARLEAPSLRPLSNQDIAQTQLLTDVDGPFPDQWHFMNPRELRVAESMRMHIDYSTAADRDVFGIAWLGDGPQQPVSGNMFTTRMTVTNFQHSLGEWTASELTFSQFLPVQRFQIVGMQCETSAGIIARLIFSGTEFRPGTPTRFFFGRQQGWNWRYGRSGVWGEFDVNQPPRLEILGLANSANDVTVWFDLIRTG